jgi:hypothetical protein
MYLYFPDMGVNSFPKFDTHIIPVDIEYLQVGVKTAELEVV